MTKILEILNICNYYIQYLFVPLLYCIVLCKELYNGINRAFRYTHWNMRTSIQGHKRAFKKD